LEDIASSDIMTEDWGSKLVAFLIIFFIFWMLGWVVFGDYRIGFATGILVAGIFVGVVVSRNR
jgi:hypothetical protein